MKEVNKVGDVKRGREYPKKALSRKKSWIHHNDITSLRRTYSKRNAKSDLTMYMNAKKTEDESKALKEKKWRRIFRRNICLFLFVVIVELLVGFTINGKMIGMLRGMNVVQKIFNITRVHRGTVYVRSKGNMMNLKTSSLSRFDQTFQSKELSRIKQSRQLPRSTISTPAATVLQTVTSKMPQMPNFEFYYQRCDWIQRNNLTTLNQMYTNCSRLCPPKPPYLVGLLYTAMESLTFQDLEKKFLMLRPGGKYSPQDCRARHHVAIIIPYRNRERHLRILLNNLHPFLQKQQLDYGIFVIEQAEGSTFNRAMLMNIGFKEALSTQNYSCFIFHDVDHIPENDNNTYGCNGNPRHMAVAVDKFGYRMPYPNYFGGVSSLSRKEMELVNGFSNKYFGWGGEDDDMWRRIRAKNLKILRHSPNIGRYRTIRHKRDKGNEPNGVSVAEIDQAISRMDKDGLNSLKYTRIKRINRKICTWILVKINQPEQLNTKAHSK